MRGSVEHAFRRNLHAVAATERQGYDGAMPNPPTLAEEQAAFEALLPQLLETHAGKYVLFKDGEPVEFFDHHEAAFNAGLERFGLDAVFLVAPIEPAGPRSVSLAWDAGVMFG